MKNLRTGELAYKVVTSERESVSQLFIKAWMYDFESSRLMDLMRKKRLIKKYEKGSIVKAGIDMPPLLCFSAIEFASKWALLFSKVIPYNHLILEVAGYDSERPATLPFTYDRWIDLLKLNKGFNPDNRRCNIPGCVAYRRLRVIS